MLPDEDRPRRDHQQRADDQRAPPPDAIGVGGQPQADQGVAGEGQREEESDLAGVEPGRGQVQDEDDAEGAVAGHPDRPREEEQPRVPGHRAECRWPRWPTTPTTTSPPTATTTGDDDGHDDGPRRRGARPDRRPGWGAAILGVALGLLVVFAGDPG